MKRVAAGYSGDEGRGGPKREHLAPSLLWCGEVFYRGFSSPNKNIVWKVIDTHEAMNKKNLQNRKQIQVQEIFCRKVRWSGKMISTSDKPSIESQS